MGLYRNRWLREQKMWTGSYHQSLELEEHGGVSNDVSSVHLMDRGPFLGDERTPRAYYLPLGHKAVAIPYVLRGKEV